MAFGAATSSLRRARTLPGSSSGGGAAARALYALMYGPRPPAHRVRLPSIVRREPATPADANRRRISVPAASRD